MNREDIIRMAREVGLADSQGVVHAFYQLESFAVLVASAQLEEVAKQFDKMPFGDTAASFAIFVRNMKS